MASSDLSRSVSSFELDVVHNEVNGTYSGYVHLGPYLVFELVEPTSRTPDGIEDFANVVEKKFAHALAAAIQQQGAGTL